MRELVIRYGWPTHTFWSGGQLEHDISTFRDVGILFVAPPYSAKEYRRDRQAFFPAFATVDAPFSAGETDWQTSLPAGKTFDEWWPSEHMRLPTYIRPVPNGQEVYLRRDTTIRLVSAVDDAASALAVGPDESWVAILLGSTGPDDIRTLQELAMHGTQTLRFDLTVPPSPLFMMSTEVLLPGRARNALRARRGVVFPQTLQEMAKGSVALSTPLFLALPTDVRETPTDPDSASAFLAGTLSFSRTATLAVYWESYGFAARDTVDVRLRVVRDDDAGRIRRAGEILGVVAERRDSVSIGWREPDVRRGRVLDVASVMPVVSRGLLVNTQQLPVGVYRILLEMRRVDGATAHSEQRVILRD